MRPRCCSNAVTSLEVRITLGIYALAQNALLIAIDNINTAIDVWSAGMILLFFLTGKFPILQANDDTEALVEISSILGRKRMERTATLHSEFASYPLTAMHG